MRARKKYIINIEMQARAREHNRKFFSTKQKNDDPCQKHCFLSLVKSKIEKNINKFMNMRQPKDERTAPHYGWHSVEEQLNRLR